MLYKMVELVEGTPIQYLGVYILKWQQEWGEPEFGFVEYGDNEIIEPIYKALRDCENYNLNSEVDCRAVARAISRRLHENINGE